MLWKIGRRNFLQEAKFEKIFVQNQTLLNQYDTFPDESHHVESGVNIYEPKFKETMKNAREKSDVFMEPAMEKYLRNKLCQARSKVYSARELAENPALTD